MPDANYAARFQREERRRRPRRRRQLLTCFSALSVCLFVSLCFCLSVCLSVYLSVCGDASNVHFTGKNLSQELYGVPPAIRNHSVTSWLYLPQLYTTHVNALRLNLRCSVCLSVRLRGHTHARAVAHKSHAVRHAMSHDHRTHRGLRQSPVPCRAVQYRVSFIL